MNEVKTIKRKLYREYSEILNIDSYCWDRIKTELTLNYTEQEIKIEVAGGDTIIENDMDKAYGAICRYTDDINKITINARKKKAEITIEFINVHTKRGRTLIIHFEGDKASEKFGAIDFLWDIKVCLRAHNYYKAVYLVLPFLYNILLNKVFSYYYTFGAFLLTIPMVFVLYFIYKAYSKLLQGDKYIQFSTDKEKTKTNRRKNIGRALLMDLPVIAAVLSVWLWIK